MYIERDFDYAQLSVFTSNKTSMALYFPGFRFRCTIRWERLVFVTGRGWGFPSERCGDARRLAYWCIFRVLVSLRVFIAKHEEILKNCFFNSLYLLDSCNHSLKRSLLGVKNRLGHAQIGLLYWFNSKFPTSIPAPFIWEAPTPWGVYPSGDHVAWPLRLGEHCCYLANEKGFPSFTEWRAQ